MAVRLRLMRMGKKKQPTYRVVAADKRKARNGRFIEIIGFYDPRSEPSVIRIENEKAVRWLSEGALPSERVEKLLKISGAWDEFKGLPPGTSVTAPPVVSSRPASAVIQEPDAAVEVEESAVEVEESAVEVEESAVEVEESAVEVEESAVEVEESAVEVEESADDEDEEAL